MDRARMLAGVWPGRLALALTLAFAVAACGSADGGTNGPDTSKMISQIQGVFGTSMISGTVEGDAITITIDNAFSAGGAKLFMCANIVDIVEKNGGTDVVTVVIVNQKGDELSTSADCS